MLVCEVKRNLSNGKNLLETDNPNLIIDKLVEKPLQKACKEFKYKNIETCMSSSNKSNILKSEKKYVTKKEILNKAQKHRLQTFLQAGKGCAWIMINYNTLSKENKEIVFSLKDKLGEDIIWFVKPTFANFYKKLQNFFKQNDVVLSSGDEYDKKFEDEQLILMYNTNQYPGRSVFIRMPIDNKTTIKDVEDFYDKITEKFVKQ